jgi:hypothetical protein
MSILDNGRNAANIKWVAQLLYNGGIDELTSWLAEQEQHTKDDIASLFHNLSHYIREECEPKLTEAEYDALEVSEPDYPQVWEPLRLVKPK